MKAITYNTAEDSISRDKRNCRKASLHSFQRSSQDAEGNSFLTSRFGGSSADGVSSTRNLASKGKCFSVTIINTLSSAPRYLTYTNSNTLQTDFINISVGLILAPRHLAQVMAKMYSYSAVSNCQYIDPLNNS